MTVLELLGSSWAELAAVVAATVGVFAAVIVATRFLGLRSFAKMSGFDFAATVAIGSIFAATATGSSSLASGALALAVLYAVQGVLSRLRLNDGGAAVLDNEPVMLMEEGTLLEDNMRTAGVSEADVIAKLREANVLRLEQVRFVVLEATGDVSVLHSDSPDAMVDAVLVDGVRGRPRQPS